MNDDARFEHLQPNSEMCFGCGRANPVGLYMKFRDDGVGRVLSEYTVAERYQGYPGLVHGGVIATMLDEAVARVSFIGDPHHFMMSVKLQVSFRHPVPVETPLRVVGRIVKLRGRLGKAVGEVILPDGTVAAEAECTLADIPAELMDRSHLALLGWRTDR
jgi:uncharacterized protein (TIGR00369 family)